jgi:hypothetical protein
MISHRLRGSLLGAGIAAGLFSILLVQGACVIQPAPAGGGGGDAGTAVSVPACPAPPLGYTQSPLPILPPSSWTQNGGIINPVCTPSPDPFETGFFAVDAGTDAGGVELTAGSNDVSCCTCTARSRSFPVPATPVQGTHLQGALAAARGAKDPYSVGSMRITLKFQGSSIGSRVFAQESRPNDNCVGSSEMPETVLAQDDFDIDVAPFATGGTQFDEVDVDLNGYACVTGTSEIVLSCMSVATAGAPGSGGDGGTSSSSGAGGGGPTTVGFFPTGCEDPANPNDRDMSGTCPNGVDLTGIATVTCQASPCQGASCSVQGPVMVQGNQAVADCSGLRPICDGIAQTVANPQIVIPTRIPCN